MDRYRYRLRNSGYGSQRYGNCEVCGEYCSEVFILIEKKKMTQEKGWTGHNCIECLFGHEDCCKKQMKTENSIGYVLIKQPDGIHTVFDAQNSCLGEYKKGDDAFKALTDNAGL